MLKLGVNIDHIATIRQARKENFPSVVEAAALCEKAGAQGITVHLREDRRHIQDRDIYDLRKSIRTKLNLEMAAEDEIINIAVDAKPDFVCLVPEKRQELTTEGGLNVLGSQKKFAMAVEKLKRAGIKVSMFIDPDIEQVEACSKISADCIELHTGKYAAAYKNFGKNSKEFQDEFGDIINASNRAIAKGLILNAGHGLDYDNIEEICKIEKMNEFNIGFSIIARAVFCGLEQAVSEMKELMAKYSQLG
ncbi:MAG: pyridoxine 5'-phosphate synthase [Elusimicrobiota bacterium]|jgi:pyridoxine 5-phosphate synthase|nr:pyridoxine 5'-phosphate synthase [Elusimicrobiota bacterium]